MAEKKNFPPRRSGFRHLAREIKFEGQIADKDSISEMSRQVWSKKDPGVLNQIADHFRNFDPKNPDYSRLS
jgi:hypothetical protein